MDKILRIYQVAQKCGFDAKHREDNDKVAFAFKAKDIPLNCFFEVAAQSDEKLRENVAHELFVLSDNFDPHTETKKYLEKIGGNLKQYTDIYSQMTDLAWQIRKFWLSL